MSAPRGGGAMSEPLLQIRNLSKRFPGVQALMAVDLDLFAGEIHALVGENGAGKSTLLRILAGIDPAEEGEIRFEGRPVTLSDPRKALGLGIAAIHQEASLCPDLSVAENLFLGHLPRTRPGWVDRPRLQREARRLLEPFGAAISPAARVGELTPAQKQMVAIARALSQSVRVLILDEPTAFFTEQETACLFALLKDLRARNTGILYISHRLEEIFRLSDRVTVLRDGERVATRPTRELNSYELIRLMVGRFLESAFPRTRPAPGEAVLEVRDLACPPLLEGISFEIRSHEILGLAGLVGAGRSELAQALFGLHRAASGQIQVAGRPLPLGSPRAAMAHGVAYVPEDRQRQGLFSAMSVGQNLTIQILHTLATGGWVRRPQEEALARSWVERLGVRPPHLKPPIRTLSGGNQQKVLLARSLAAHPRVLLLDEPTRGVDVGARAEIHCLIDRLAADGMAILLISSELPEVLGMSDRVMVLRQGRIVAHFGFIDGLPTPTPEGVLQAAFGAERPQDRS